MVTLLQSNFCTLESKVLYNFYRSSCIYRFHKNENYLFFCCLFFRNFFFQFILKYSGYENVHTIYLHHRTAAFLPNIKCAQKTTTATRRCKMNTNAKRLAFSILNGVPFKNTSFRF